MSRKVLFCATVDFHFRAFHLPVMEWFKERGWEVHIAARGELDLPSVDRKFNISIERSPLRSGNWAAYRQLKDIMKRNDYDIIHAHTPMGGVLARLAAAGSRKKGTRMLYTAHGFHFCQGSSLASWLLYYPIEKGLSRLTDCLITINDEDYRLAVGRGFRAGQIEHVHGVGVNTDKFKPAAPAEKERLRQQSAYGTEEVLMFYAGEFNGNKNHQLLIRALARIKDQGAGIKLLLAGEGPLQEQCRLLASELGVAGQVDFLGYRKDIDRLLPLCDAAVSSSLREGLPVNIMEAMACGLPVIATRNRGHAELVKPGENGYLVEPGTGQEERMAGYMLELSRSSELRSRMGKKSLELVQTYNLTSVVKELGSIYIGHMREEESYEAGNQHYHAHI
ncbi:glycosyltransferase family 4 protein [Paenibacillus sp. URB8-2]|uniref:glycosyltransferase family 4 protein n=1 Tax=Paenibacillus sp. URB8-2 TaxID=2741301 RepID=UPI0015BB0730|nr:glycosyltransferase family 4 protein [Paenibacillus sp. URB8-2]BCG57419.1 putative glycosyltransferase EpsD [Paenibacillus sp. URB8-2]